MVRNKLFLGSLGLLLSLLAQAQPGYPESVRQTDSLIKVQIIDPAEADAHGEAPDWDGLTATIKGKYDATYADRTITKAKIYYYYGKDWPVFSAAIVHYTQAYEDKEDLKLMNKNAKFILQYSENPDELKAALGWVKHAANKDPANPAYKETCQGLEDKLKKG